MNRITQHHISNDKKGNKKVPLSEDSILNIQFWKENSQNPFQGKVPLNFHGNEGRYQMGTEQ